MDATTREKLQVQAFDALDLAKRVVYDFMRENEELLQNNALLTRLLQERSTESQGFYEEAERLKAENAGLRSMAEAAAAKVGELQAELAGLRATDLAGKRLDETDPNAGNYAASAWFWKREAEAAQKKLADREHFIESLLSYLRQKS